MAIRRVQAASAPDGTPFAAWVEHQLVARPGMILFTDWSASQRTVRFSYALRDERYRVSTHAFEWRLDEKGGPVPIPHHINLAREIHSE